MEQRNEMLNKITESEQFQNIKERMEKQEIKKAAKKIVGEQIKSSIETEVTDFQMSRLQHNVVLAVSIYCNFLFIQSIIPEYGNSQIGNAIFAYYGHSIY